MKVTRMAQFEELQQAGDYITYSDGKHHVAGIIILCPVCEKPVSTDDRWVVEVIPELEVKPSIVHLTCGAHFWIKKGDISYADGEVLREGIRISNRSKG